MRCALRLITANALTALRASACAPWARWAKLRRSERMPVVRIDMLPRSKKEKEKLIEGVIEAVAKTLKIERDWVRVVIDEIPAENWGVDGKQLSELMKKKK